MNQRRDTKEQNRQKQQKYNIQQKHNLLEINLLFLLTLCPYVPFSNCKQRTPNEKQTGRSLLSLLPVRSFVSFQFMNEGLEALLNLNLLVCFDKVAFLNVVVTCDGETAIVA